MKKEFPELALKAGGRREERVEALDLLDTITRSKIDTFAKEEILKIHPEWVVLALDHAAPEKMTIGLRTEGGKVFFSGLDKKEKRQALMKQLDSANLGVTPDLNTPLNVYTADNQVYYRITVLERAPKTEILTFGRSEW